MKTTKILLGIFAVVLALSARLQAQFAYITNADNTLTITTVTNTNGVIVVPASINGLAVTVFGNGSEVFTQPSKMTNCALPNGLTEIGENAFEDCYYLTNVTVPNTVNTIGSYAFYYCESLPSINIPEGVTTIQYETFYYCTNLSNPKFPDSLTSIEDYAFEECYHLQNLTIGPNITTIGEEAFAYCGMTNLVIGTNAPTAHGSCSIGYEAFYECTNMANALIGCSVTGIGYEAFAYCVMTNLVIGTNGFSPYGGCAIDYDGFYECSGLTNVTIGTSVTSIGYGAFEYLYSTNLTLGANGYSPNGGCSVGYEAFYDSTMTNITIGNNVISIDYEAFESCYYLSNLVIGDNTSGPNGGCYIGYYAFGDCYERNAWIGNNVTTIDYEAFEDSYNLLNLWIGTNVSGIGYDAFDYCPKLTNAYIGGGNLGYESFEDCYVLTNVVFGPNVKTIGYEAFYECGMNNLVIPDNVSAIQDYAFEYCTNLTNVTIGNGVTAIPYEAFVECYALRTVTFGANVGGLGDYAFYKCTNLTALYFHGNAPGADSTAFYSDKITNMTAYYLPGTMGWQSKFDGITTSLLGAINSLQVTVEPDAARNAGAEWFLDGAAYPASELTTVYDLTPGSHTVSFAAIAGWVAPATQTFNLASGHSFSIDAIYVPTTAPSDGLILLTNGPGTINQSALPKNLVNGTKYKVTAMPDANCLFAYWQGGTAPPYSAVLSKKASYTFTMAPNLVLIANFAPNPFVTGAGNYNGLFSASNVVTEAMAGMINLSISSKGAYSGKLLIDGQSHAITGTFTPFGQASNYIARAAAEGGPLEVLLTLVTPRGLPAQVIGTVQGTDWEANNLLADQGTNAVPSAQYTMLVLPDSTNAPASAPGGDSYLLITNSAGTAKNPSLAVAKITGGLADGTTFSETAQVSADGYLPVYASLYSGKGLVWGWINLASVGAQGVGLTWIHPATTTGIYKTGFTNIALAGQIMMSQWSNPPAGLANLASLSLEGTIGETNGQTIAVTTSASGAISGSGVTGSIAPKTGLLKVTIGSGSSKISGYGAVLLNATNGGGYYVTKTNAQALELVP